MPSFSTSPRHLARSLRRQRLQLVHPLPGGRADHAGLRHDLADGEDGLAARRPERLDGNSVELQSADEYCHGEARQSVVSQIR